MAESSGLIVALGESVFEQAAHQVKAWRRNLHPGFQISVNKSPVQFGNPAPGQMPRIEQLKALGLEGDCLVVEITEGLLLSTSDNVIGQLLALSQDGIGVSLDGFGTGYSSLSYLQNLTLTLSRSTSRSCGTWQLTRQIWHFVRPSLPWRMHWA